MKPLLCLVGPTASGKSALALRLCERIGGEIVSCDSMQIYRGCDIATAKPTPQQRRQVPHHLIDICEPDERFSAAQWAQAARAACADIESRSAVPVVCGGTGFYLRALLQPEILSPVAPDVPQRARLEAELRELGAAAMHDKLAQLDAGAAQRLHRNDSFRVLRALEIASRAPSPNLVAEASAPALPAFAPLIFALDWPRAQLYERVNARVEAMLDAGVEAELRFLVAHYGAPAPALSGVGYQQMRPVLQDPARFAEGVEAWKRDTRRYAKRQLTWFRHQVAAQWLDGARPLDELVALVTAARAAAPLG